MTDTAAADPAPRCARVVVDLEPRHLDRLFDYRIPEELGPVVDVGSRVEVVFAGRKRLGLVAELTDEPSVDWSRIQPLRRTLGDHRWATADDLDLFRWAATRWASPLAHVVRHALPKRVVAVETAAAKAGWLTEEPAPLPPPEPVDPGEGWSAYDPELLADLDAGRPSLRWWWPLADEDVPARAAELTAAVSARGRGVLVLTAGPVSAMADAVAAHADDVVDIRGRRDRATYRAWLEARHGRARVVIGQRLAAFWPVRDVGLVLVEEEAAPAHKERRSPRHHVREVALERARRAGATCLLTGPVPSAPLQALLAAGRVQPLRASRKRERAAAPLVRVVPPDPVPTRLPREAHQALRAATAAGHHGVVLASQRGEGSALTCTNCPTMARCERCDALLSRTRDRTGRLQCLRCDHLTQTSWRCPNCQHDELTPLAAGAERLGEELRASLDVPVAVLQGYAPDVPPAPAVLVITRGSVLPRAPGPVGAVVLNDLHRLAARPVLGAGEDALRVAMTLAGWTRQHGLSDAPTILPADGEHDGLVRALVSWEPELFWQEEIPRRVPLDFPPAATVINIDVPGDAPTLELAAGLGATVARPLDARTRRHQLRTHDRVAATAAVADVLSAWSKDGVGDLRVDVEPVDLD